LNRPQRDSPEFHRFVDAIAEIERDLKPATFIQLSFIAGNDRFASATIPLGRPTTPAGGIAKR
jgi:hypothetical protein